MLKWLSEGSRLLAIAIVFATLVTAQAQSQSTNPITVTVEPDLSLRLDEWKDLAISFNPRELRNNKVHVDMVDRR